jgi:hypothetical protein
VGLRTHEHILPSVRRTSAVARWWGLVIHHVGYQDPGLRLQMLDRDLRILYTKTVSSRRPPSDGLRSNSSGHMASTSCTR